MSQPKISKNRISKKAKSFNESVIREMSREAAKYSAVNLGQGFGMMLAWSGLFWVINRWLWRRGLKHYSGMGA